jgi:predicted DNA-binding transcriptional regulator AlpA
MNQTYEPAPEPRMIAVAPALVSDRVAAEYVGLSRSAFRAAVRRKILPRSVRVSGAVRWVVAELDDAIKALQAARQ